MAVNKKRKAALRWFGYIGGSSGGGSTPTQATSLAVVNSEDDNQDLTVVRGGTTLVVYNQTGAVDFEPVENEIYTLGEDLGDGNFVGYIGNDSSFNVSGLTADTDTHYKAFTVVADGDLRTYFIDDAPTANERTFITQYQAGIDYAVSKSFVVPSTIPSLTQAQKFVVAKAINGRLKAAVMNTYFTNSAAFYLHYLPVIELDDLSLIDWKNPGDDTLASSVNAIFSAKGGWNGNGVDAYIDYPFIPSTDGAGIFTQNNAKVFSATPSNIKNTVAKSVAPWGMFTTGLASMHIVFGTNLGIRMNGTVSPSPAFTDTYGAWFLKRTSSSNMQLIRNATTIYNDTNTSSGLPAARSFGLGRNTNGVASTFFPGQLQCFILSNNTVTDANIKTWWDDTVTAMNAALPNPSYEVTSRTQILDFTDGVTNDVHIRPTIAEVNNTVVMVTKEARFHTDYSGSYCNINFSADKGATWTANNVDLNGNAVVGFPHVATHGSSNGVNEQYLIKYPNGDLGLFTHEANEGGTPPNDFVTCWLHRSTDGGRTWTSQEDFGEQSFIPDKRKFWAMFGQVIIGTTLYVTYFRYATDTRGNGDSFVELMKTEDNGATWEHVSTIFDTTPLPTANECGITHLGDGVMVAVARTYDTFPNRTTVQKYSFDYGETWHDIFWLNQFFGGQRIDQPTFYIFDGVIFVSGRGYDGDTNRRNLLAWSHDRCQTWSYLNLDESVAGDAGYCKMIQVNETTFRLIGYYGTTDESRIYEYIVERV